MVSMSEIPELLNIIRTAEDHGLEVTFTDTPERWFYSIHGRYGRPQLATGQAAGYEELLLTITSELKRLKPPAAYVQMSMF